MAVSIHIQDAENAYGEAAAGGQKKKETNKPKQYFPRTVVLNFCFDLGTYN